VSRSQSDDTPCGGCGARVVWARVPGNGANNKLVAMDAEPREGGRVVLVHQRVGEPPAIWFLNDEELEKSRGEHISKVKAQMEEPGPHRLFVFHDCREGVSTSDIAGYNKFP
jgi:hypothetical protein